MRVAWISLPRGLPPDPESFEQIEDFVLNDAAIMFGYRQS